MAEVKNCPNCGKLYMENPRKLCPDCQEQEMRDEETVAAYLRDVGHASIDEVCRDTGIKESIVFKMIKRGSITDGLSYPCEACGKPIERGHYCDACANQLKQDFANLQPKQKPVEKKVEKSSSRERLYMNRD